MSREIDFSQPLSDEDMEYVQQRPWLIQDAEMRGLKIESANDFTVAEAETDTGAEGVNPEQSASAPTEEESEEDETEDEDSDDEDDQPYEEWDYADLKEEAGNRGLSKSGSKEQLIERLQSNDAENE